MAFDQLILNTFLNIIICIMHTTIVFNVPNNNKLFIVYAIDDNKSNNINYILLILISSCNIILANIISHIPIINMPNHVLIICHIIF